MTDQAFPEFELADVREALGFEGSLYPQADGQDLCEAVEWSSRKQRFLSLYYLLNSHYTALGEARKLGNDEDVASLLKAIQVDYDMRQSMERHYSPIGFIGEPDLDGVFVTNVRFSYSRFGPEAQDEITPSSMTIQIPLPDEILADIASAESSETT